MLKRRERGKEASTSKKDVKPLPFGHSEEAGVIEGLEVRFLFIISYFCGNDIDW